MAKDGKRLIEKIGNNQQKTKHNATLVSIKQDTKARKEKITFSLSYFKQIPNFEIGDCSQRWYIGLLERLESLGKMTQKEILEENKGSLALRCHPIDWKAKNIPIQRKDLNWLPDEILNNESEFPMIQLSISKSTGRIIGYFNMDSSIFHIVLLDPKHNMQPSKKTNYQIQKTYKGISQYDELLNKLERIKKIVENCPDKCCDLHSHIEVIEGLHDNIVYIGLDDNFYVAYQEMLQKYSLQEIIKRGISVEQTEDTIPNS